jgi:predicted ester cyclase
MSQELKDKVRRFYDEAWNAGRFDVIDELFSEDYLDHDAVAHTGKDGRTSAKKFIRVFRAAFPDLRLAIQDQIAEGSTVVTRSPARCVPASGGPATSG